jgi:hypothetical protein
MVKVSTFISKAAELQELDVKYPVPQRPPGGTSYTFPSNADSLSDSQMDDWLLFLGAWRGYMGYQISKLEGTLVILSEGFDLMMSTRVAGLEAESSKRLLKDSLKGQAVLEDEELQNLKIRIIDLTAESRLLKGRLSLYESQFETLSRVVTRRGHERMRL